LNLDRVEEAQVALTAVQVEETGDPWLLRSRGRVAFNAQQYDNAAADFAESLRLEPANAATMYQLGLCLERTGATSEAAQRVECGKELENLVEAAQRILKVAQSDRDGQEVAGLVFQLAELFSKCELWEDCQYCCEFVLRIEPQANRATKLLALAASKLQEQSQPSERASRPPTDRLIGRRPAAESGTFGSSDVTVRFRDVASACGLAFEYFTGNTGKKYLFETLGGGACAFDCDGDGWPDCYFSQGSRFPPDDTGESFRDQLFRNLQGKRFEQVTELAGLGDLNYTIGCCAADFDNDGFSDIFIANYGPNRAYRNNGDGTFAEVSSELGVDVVGMNSSLAMADLDRDGDLDLYVVNYLASIDVCKDRQEEVFACHPSAFQAQQDILLENLGDGRFLDVTDGSGIEAPDGKGLGVVIADLDNDGWADIYIANDTTPNFLFRNVNSLEPSSAGRLRFLECGLLAGAALSRDGKARAGMGIACADFDDNGYLDLYVTNYYLESNAFFLNQGKATFVDSVRPASIVANTTPLLGFGTQPIDADLDGRVDLFVANGHVDDYRKHDRTIPWKMPPKLYRNTGPLEFHDISSVAGGYFEGNYLGRGVTRLDWNRDNRPDLIVVNQNEPAALLENITETSSHQIVLELVGVSTNRDAVNTRLNVHTGGRSQTIEVIGGDGYLASNERRQIVGLGDHKLLDQLEIFWPSGRRDCFTGIPADHSMLIIEGREPSLMPQLRRF
jgi:hypothetical protein